MELEEPMFVPDLARKVASREGALIYPGWGVVAVAFLMMFLGAGPIFYAYGVYAVAFAEAFHASRTLINLGFTAVLVVSGVGSAPIGWMVEKLGLRRVALIGVVGTAAGMAIVAFTTAMWQVVLIFATFISMADALIGVVVTNMLVARWFERRRGLAIGISVMGASAAAVVFPPLTSLIAQTVGWRGTFLAYGALFLVLVPLVMRWGKAPADGIPQYERSADPGKVLGDSRPALSTAALLRDADFWSITLSIGTLIGINGAVMITLVPFATGAGIGMTSAALLVSTVGGAALTGKLLFGLVADRIDLRWALRLALVLASASLAIFFLAEGYGWWLIASGVFGLSLGGMLPVWGAIMAHIYGRAGYGHALGFSRAAMTPLSFGCPLLAGAVFDLTGTYQAAWAAFFALVVLGFALTFVRSKPWAPD